MICCKTRLSVVIFALFILVLTACHKETYSPAQITILLPSANSSFSVFDSLHIQAKIHSENRLKECKLRIVQTDLSSVLPPKIIPLNSDTALINETIYIDNKYLDKLNYLVQISVLDVEENLTNAFVPILINELPLRSEAVYVVTNHNNQKVVVYKIDTLQQVVPVIEYFGDYAGSDISSRHNVLFISGRYSGPVAAYSTGKEHVLIWKEDAVLNPPFPYFQSIAFDGNYVLSGRAECKVKGFKPDGMLQCVFETPDLLPNRFLRHIDEQYNRNVLLVSGPVQGGMSSSLHVFSGLSYTSMQYTNFSWSVAEMFKKNNDEIYIFGNDGDEGVIRVYVISQNGFYSLKNISEGKITDVAEINPGEYLISHTHGMMLFLAQTNSLVPLNVSEGNGVIACDNTRSKWYHGLENQLSVFAFSTSVAEKTFTFDAQIENILIYYNK